MKERALCFVIKQNNSFQIKDSEKWPKVAQKEKCLKKLILLKVVEQ